ncbi:acyl-CoA carboxylase subunit epsilon [Cellulomonas dongxiuzhuiae]|uniref:Acyl-CoA carboxylase subunit epsilon n=1 Tax=Cellulomonas dongxiuzhuiae TaxID=2819979 RepID=A0ABX8GMF7_9CELL|nr:acyl-CoA carboxylase subunit epsilon [Cellulomonas dongxiuzhuiae]MBO3089055.1 acyl-CoA carboxylase subunit epsilon [Cellulomonas dongxiuzhuiae]MBO3096611.1 acyl-CoA carboxylase subunit epsilon [Cellulomonas dongxiuzhuiae]QWC16993.1 acyl-CoA carboxylase subunit epsilon [Cellulomonas dongxiuzhuiae]
MTAEPQDVARAEAHVHVVRGAPDDDELAALVAGLVATAAGHGPQDEDTDAPARAARARWMAPGRLRGAAVPAHGPDAWRWSLRV